MKEISSKNERSKAMNSQDIAKIGNKVKRETEAFINRYINDRAKGWPVICHPGSVCTGYCQEKHVHRCDILQTLQTR